MAEQRTMRLQRTREALAGRAFVLGIDETGDRKQGHTTAYAAAQYQGGRHRVEQGMVSVNAYGVLDHVTVPLACALYQPKTRLKPGDRFQTKPELALCLIQQVLALGFRFEVFLADTGYGDHATLINALHHLGLRYVVAIRSTHGVWMGTHERIRTTPCTPWHSLALPGTPWRPFARVFADGSRHERSLRETVFRRRRPLRSFQITTDPVRLLLSDN